MKNTVDIILPCFNCEKTIDETLKSIKSQSYKKWRLLVIDDGSQDKTLGKIKSYSKNKKIKIKIIKIRENKGAGFCRNLALKFSKSEYVAFIDSDDIWQKNKLKIQLEFMKKNKHMFSYTNYIAFKKINKNIIKNKILVPSSFNQKKFIKNTSICTSTMMIKRSIIKNVKFTNTKRCEDFFFKCQILKRYTAFRVNKYLTLYRISKNSLQSSKIKNIYWLWKINARFNKLNFIENIISIFYISINSIKKYGIK
jgi:teichuronic acid biosynthesis glycosyltransferase TuaG|tara:strand:- start:195 stop:953 length:759 start_codon:yes stop_codon:yes gene_type:complete